MSNRVPVTAQWALWSKHPGTNNDYSVLSCSDGKYSSTEFAAIVVRFAVGSPSVHKEGAGKLPWVTFSWVGPEHDLQIGVAIQEATEHVDGAGRPVVRTSYFCVPFQPMADNAISYLSLYSAVRELELPEHDGSAISLKLPSLDAEELALSLDYFDHETIFTTASMLLRGPVSIVQAEDSTLAERLRFLDAVSAALPYGYRAKYTAATWSDSGVRHRIRLAFADRAHQNAAAVTWRRRASMSAGSPEARRYLTQLYRVLGKSPDSGPPVAQTDLLTHLALATVPHKFDDSQYAIVSVRELDLPFAVYADAREGQADLAELRQVFDQPRIGELPADKRRTVLAGLVSAGTDDDLDRLDRWWDRIAPSAGQAIATSAGEAGQPDLLLSALTSTTRRLLWTHSPSESVRRYLALAGKSEMDDAVLAELIIPPSATTVPAVGLAHAAQLLVDCMFASGVRIRRQRVTDQLASNYPRTLAALPANPSVACELAAHLAAAGFEARSAVEWLAGRLPVLLAPFQAIVAARPRQVSADAIGDLQAAGWDCLRALLAAASHLGRLDLVLPGMIAWLAASSPLDDDERKFWRSQLAALVPSAAADQASVDLALLALGESPRWLLKTAQTPEWAAYRERLVGQSAKLGLRTGSPKGQEVSAALFRYLDGPDWPVSAPQAIAVAELIAQFAEGNRKSILAGLAGSVLWTDHAVRQQPALNKWLDRIDRDVIHRSTQYSLRRLPSGVTVDRVAVVCERAFHVGLSPDDAGKSFAQSAALPLRPEGAEMLDGVRVAYGLEPTREGSLLRRLAGSGAPGDEQGAEGGHQASGGIFAAIGRVLGRSDADPRQGSPAQELTREQRESLKRLQDWIDAFTRSARRAWQRTMADGGGQAVDQARQVNR